LADGHGLYKYGERIDESYLIFRGNVEAVCNQLARKELVATVTAVTAVLFPKRSGKKYLLSAQ